MKTITEMRDEIKALMKDLGDMKADLSANNREPSDEEREKAHSLLARVDELEANIALEERVQQTEERLQKPIQKATKPDPSEGFKKSAEEQRKKDSFLSFGEQLTAVVRACSPGGWTDPRLFTERRATGLSEGVGTDGGFLVQHEFASRIIEPMWAEGAVTSRINRINIGEGSNGLKINAIDETSRVAGSRWGGIRGYWESEAGTKTASKPKFRQINLELKKLIGLCYATDELIADARALEGVISRGFRSEFEFQITDGAVNGTGAGRPLGYMSSGSLITVAKETGQSATTIVAENIWKMWARMLAPARQNAVWLINQDCEPQLFQLALAVGTGGAPLYVPPGGISAAPYATLMGRPVIPCESCQTLGTKGDIALCSFQDGYVAIDKGGIQQDMSIHVRFVYDESVFRFVYRYDGQVVLAKPVTPFKGSNTLSHFIVLASRS